MAEQATVPPEGSAKRRESWSLTSLVEEVSGRPIGDFQDPARQPHPYVEFHRKRLEGAAAAARAPPEEALDPVDRVYPPLAGATGRELHGPSHEHHPETLASVERPEDSTSELHHRHPPGPSRRPERVYLHYLLLHLDRLNDAGLAYLRNAVDEELRHRQESRASAGPT